MVTEKKKSIIGNVSMWGRVCLAEGVSDILCNAIKSMAWKMHVLNVLKTKVMFKRK